MPNRLVREGWLDSDPINSLTWQAECFFLRLLLRADDFGRATGDLRVLRASLYPLKLDQVREADVARWIAECVKANLVRLYEVDSKRFLVVPKFNQRTRALASKYPAPPPGPEDAVDQSPSNDGHLSDGRQTEDGHPRTETKTKTETNTTSPPEGGSGDLPFLSEKFRETFDRFVCHRKEIKKPLRQTGRSALLADLARHTEMDAIAALEKSMANGWQGVFFGGNGNSHPPPADLKAKRKERERQEAYDRQVAEQMKQPRPDWRQDPEIQALYAEERAKRAEEPVPAGKVAT